MVGVKRTARNIINLGQKIFLKQTPTLEGHCQELRIYGGMAMFGITIILVGMAMPETKFNEITIDRTVSIGALTLARFAGLYQRVFHKIQSAGVSPPIP